MQRVFIQAVSFKKSLHAFDKDGSLLLQIEGDILRNPRGGDVFPGLVGIRKLRIAAVAEKRGKRGSYRVLFLDLPDVEHTHLLYIYKKGDSEDISPEGKKRMRQLVQQIKETSHGKK